jgi:NDP-sugar pyrophosphorylase family protein
VQAAAAVTNINTNTSSSSSSSSSDEFWSMRRLLEREIETLRTAGRCRSPDWSRHCLVLRTEQHHLDQSADLARLVSDCQLEDTVVLICHGVVFGAQTTADAAHHSAWNKLPVGLHSNLVVSNSIVHLDAKIHRNSYIVDTYIGPDAVVLNCGRVSCREDFFREPLDRVRLVVGPESGGGRELTVQLESTMMQVAEALVLAGSSSSTPSTPQEAACTITNNKPMNILDRHSLVRDTPTIDSVYLYPHSCIEAACAVQRVVLCSGACIRSASTVESVLMQWETSIAEQSSVTTALLMEQSHVGPHSIVVSSILGPDVHVAAGEIHACVLGPNTVAHHQSLLIGVVWPLGRGNVGYGANVGSNHTGRLPDQECVAGEGVFWGLSCVIKFPVDLSAAPYSIVAAGTALPPQRITMPFSLIVSSADGNSSNDILPGWLLRSSPYTLARSEKKFETRRKASRHYSYTGWTIVRAETVALCCDARSALQCAEVEGASCNQVSGIGHCRLSERARVTGIEAYTDFIQRYVLRGLLSFVVEHGGRSMDISLLLDVLSGNSRPPRPVKKEIEWQSFPWNVSEEEAWDFQRHLLEQEFPMKTGDTAKVWLGDSLRRLVSLENEFAEQVLKSKKRDDVRGSQTIPDYENSHVLAENDPVICDTKLHAQMVEEMVLQVL